MKLQLLRTSVHSLRACVALGALCACLFATSHAATSLATAFKPAAENCAPECNQIVYQRFLGEDCADGTYTFCPNNVNPPTPPGKNCCDHLHKATSYYEWADAGSITCKKKGVHGARKRKYEVQFCEQNGSGQTTGNCAVNGEPVECDHLYYSDTLVTCPRLT